MHKPGLKPLAQVILLAKKSQHCLQNARRTGAPCWCECTVLREGIMLKDVKSLAYLSSALVPIIFAGVSLSTPALAACLGPAGTPNPTQTKCVTAIQIPGNPLRSFRHQLGQSGPRRNIISPIVRTPGIDVIDTKTLTFKRTIGGFVGIKLNPAGTAVNNNHIRAGRRCISSALALCRRWRQHAQGDRSRCATATAIKQTISTGGTTRLDEMAITEQRPVAARRQQCRGSSVCDALFANGNASHQQQFT